MPGAAVDALLLHHLVADDFCGLALLLLEPSGQGVSSWRRANMLHKRKLVPPHWIRW